MVVYCKVDYLKSANETKFVRRKVLEVASEYPRYNFAVSNTVDHHIELGDFGVSVNALSGEPIVTATVGGARHRMEEGFSMESFRQFIRDVAAGRKEPTTDGILSLMSGENLNAEHFYSLKQEVNFLHKELDKKEKLEAENRRENRRLEAENEELRRMLEALTKK